MIIFFFIIFYFLKGWGGKEQRHAQYFSEQRENFSKETIIIKPDIKNTVLPFILRPVHLNICCSDWK